MIARANSESGKHTILEYMRARCPIDIGSQIVRVVCSRWNINDEVKHCLEKVNGALKHRKLNVIIRIVVDN